MLKLNWRQTTCALGVLWMAAIAAPAQTFTTLCGFDRADGANPHAGLSQGSDGNLYGTTSAGGRGSGTVFKVTPTGTLTTLHAFDGTDGKDPVAAPIQATDGNFYGTTSVGGLEKSFCSLGCGTVFKMSPSGTLNKLYTFCSLSLCADGADPHAGLVQATDGSLYGTTALGGANGLGTVFKISLGGNLTTLYSFCAQSGCGDGYYPHAPVLQATDGNFYGTTSLGGAHGGGTVFRLTAGGTLTTLYSFCSAAGCTDGQYPWGALVQAADGSFYGTTAHGGTDGTCWDNCGTVFRITSSGTLTSLYSFSPANGSFPYAGLVVLG